MKTSKKFMAALTAMIMIILSMCTCVSAANYTNTAGTGYIPDYSGNGSSYNGNCYYQYNNNNNIGYYGYWQNNQYYDYYGNQISFNSSYSADSWFNNQYGQRFKFQWIKSPQAPAIRGDYFRAVYDMEMSYAQRGNRYNNYGVSYGYNSYNSYNNYPMGNPQMFADYWNYSNYNRMIAILNGTSGGYGGYGSANILDGREVNGQLYLDFDQCILRGEAAKLCIRTNDCWWNLPMIRNSLIFNDTYNHWAINEISQAYAVGIVNGVGGDYFAPDSTLTNQEMLTVFCNLVDRSSKYTIDNFIDMVNAGDVARITEVYWGNNDNGNGGYNDPATWRFTTHTVPLNVGDTFELKSIISSWNNNIRFNSNNTNVATVNSNGHVNAVGVGNATITGTDSYGNMDTVNVIVSTTGSDRPVVTPSPEFGFTQASITVQKGESVDLASYLENVSGNVTYASNDSNIVSVSGSMALAMNVGYANVTAICGNQTAIISIQVVDNNAKQDLNVSVQYGAFNQSGSLNLMVRGVPAGYSVKINDGDYMLQHVNEQDTGLDTMRKFQITGLYPTTGIDAEGQPEGGYDSVIVCVYDQNGVQVWEDPQGLYCPQFNAYMSTLGWY